MSRFGPKGIARGGSLILDLIAPPHCLECGVSGGRERLHHHAPLCAKCFRDLPWWRRIDGCPRCGTRRWQGGVGGRGENESGRASGRGDDSFADPFAGAAGACGGCLSGGSALHACHALLRYEGAVRRWLPAFKQAISPGRVFGPSPPVTRIMDALADLLAEDVMRLEDPVPDLVLSVPLHPRRLRERGFNHVDPIAERIARRLGADWQPGRLRRIRRTQTQASLQGEARLRNVRGAFACRRPFERELRIALVDDVLTTGSTLDSAADALLEAGAFEVRALTLAATLPRLMEDTRIPRVRQS